MAEAAAPFVWGAGGVQMTPERIAAERKLADTLMQQGMDYSPVQSWTQGVSRVAQALMGGYDYRRAGEAEAANAAADKEMVSKWFGGGATPAAPAAPAAPTVVPRAAPTVLGDGGLPAIADAQGAYGADAVMMPAAPAGDPAYRNAIASIESAGQKNPYAALGPVTSSGDRAHGRYQVMGNNVGPWTEAALGRRMTPAQFLADPAAQDQVFDHRFGTYVKQTGNPQDAASMWFSGRPLAGNTRSDVLGTTVPSYVQKFTKNLGTAAPAAVAAAPEDPAALPPNATPTQGFAIPGQPAPAAPTGMAGVNPSVVAAMASPYTSDSTKKIATILLQHQMQGDSVTTVDLGNTVGVMDKRGNIIRQLPKGEPNKGPTFGKIGTDPNTGEDQMGWINPRDQSVAPYAAPGSPTTADARTIIGPDGKAITIPQGSNVKEFRKKITDINADVAGGKSTEVQAKSEKFGNKMELAERNLSRIDPDLKVPTDEAQGPKLAARGLEYVPGGNLVQSKNYQQYKQARDNFITALLRDESGAAIGTSEFNRYEKELFPQPGDSKEVITQKREARRIAVDAMKKAAGPGYKSPTFDAAPSVSLPDGWSVQVR